MALKRCSDGECSSTDDIITRICNNGQPLQPYQTENIAKILSISKEFGNAAHLPLPYQSFFSRKPDIIIESGHQPNFLPYTGIIKKVFLLHWIARRLTDKGYHPTALFGFADQNLSTASYLHENIIPAVNKSGYEKIGFRIRKKDRWKCFDTIEKPPHDLWQKEIEKFRRIYQQRRSDSKDTAELRTRANQIIELMESSYELANNFADLNAYFFSKLCIEVFGLEVYFFRYSDIQKNSIFAEEWKELLSRNDEYIASYNTAITNQALPLHSLMKDHVPCWYHCECGGNVPLTHPPGAVKGRCPSCGKEHILSLGGDYQNLGSLLPRMSLTAVARNLVFAKGLGTRIFISGAGGGLQYGRIADAVSYSLKFPVPVTLAWESRDFYLGQTHSAALIGFLKLFKITKEDLIQSTAIRKIHDYRNILMENLQQNVTCTADKKILQKYQGQYNNSTIQLEIIQNIFSVTPSMLDIIINVSPHKISDAWIKSVEHASLHCDKESWKIRKDTTYSTHNLLNIPENDIPLIYRNISAIEVNQP